MSILALGAWLKNTACVWQDGHVRWSAPHGDLRSPQACAALQASCDTLLAQARAAGHPVRAVAHDLHPDFFSTHLALQQADVLGVPAIGVQHHHAHIAAVMAEHQLQGPVLGLALDGVGLGSDGTAWGGELLWLHGAQWQRMGHLSPLALPGGDRAAQEPWRMMAAALHASGCSDDIVPRCAPLVGLHLAQGVHSMLEAGLNCPPTSSTGRWFDAAAAALGLCVRQQDEAQAAMALEEAARRWLSQHPFADITTAHASVVHEDHGLYTLDLRPLWVSLLETPASQVDTPTWQVDEAAAGFHEGLIAGLIDWVQAVSQRTACKRVCLGGGCFFNHILRKGLTQRLQALGFEVYQPAAQFGDAGLALGQAWVAAQQLRVVPAFQKETSCV
jgi:hydrogenase maturation protein HypF